MGKGIPAGLLMTMLRGMLRAEVLTGLPPDRILHDLNQLAINDLVLYYTDGVIDTSNSLGQRFDEERLIKTLTKLCKQSFTSQEILNKIFKKLDDFTGQNRHLEDLSLIHI